MTSWKEYNRFFIQVKGTRIRNHKIAIEELGIILRRFQDLYSNIAEISTSELEKKELSLYFEDIRKGSVVIGIQHEEWEPSLIDKYEKTDKFLKDVFEITLKSDYNEALNNFKKLIPSRISRVEIFRKLENFWSTHNRTISFGIGKNYEDVELKRLIRRYKQRINTWKKKEEEELIKEVSGFIIRVKYDHPANFTFEDENGNLITGELSKNMKDVVQNFATRYIKIKGILKSVGKEYKIEKVSSIIPINNLEFHDVIKDLKIFHDLKFNVDWYEDGIILSEPRLKINLFVNKISEVEDELKDYLEILREQYINEDEDKLDGKAKDFRKDLIALLG